MRLDKKTPETNARVTISNDLYNFLVRLLILRDLGLFNLLETTFLLDFFRAGRFGITNATIVSDFVALETLLVQEL